MNTQKIIAALAVTVALGAAAPAFADDQPGLAAEHLTIAKQQVHYMYKSKDASMTEHAAVLTNDMPGVAVEHLTHKLEQNETKSQIDPVTTKAPELG